MKKLFTLILLLGGFVGTASAYYSLPGSWTVNNDNWDVSAHQFVNNTVTISLEGNTDYQFKFYNSESDSWSGAQNDGATMKYNDCTGWWFNGNMNVHLKTTISGNYTFTLSWVGENGWTPSISVIYPTTYTREVSSGNFGTICLPYAATVTGATLYRIVSTIVSGDGISGINIEPVDNTEAGKAYIFKATGSTLTATLTGNPVETASSADGMTGNLSPTPVNVANGYYVLSQNKLRKVNGGTATVSQYRAYITLAGINPAQTRGANFISFEDEATGINNIITDITGQNEAVYNLQGQRVTDKQKGLLIVNGKKMLIK